MSSLRTISLLLLGAVAGAALALGAGYFFAKGSIGQALLRNFLVAQTKTGSVAPVPEASSGATSTPSSPPHVLFVPKTYATQEYFVAINSVLQDLFAINAVNAQLGPLLNSLNEQTLSCTFVDFYESMGRAHQLAGKNQVLVSQLAMHLTALAAANTNTADAITKAGTQALAASGNALTVSLQTYVSAINGLLIGDTPTAAQIADFQLKVSAATGASQSFADALKPLLTHITQGVQAVASSTPAH